MAVVVPTYRRPDMLVRCLAALEEQQRLPDEVVVVHRQIGDGETERLVKDWVGGSGCFPRRAIQVSAQGQIAAIEAGVAATGCSVVLALDDDAMLRPDWLARALPHYADSAVVGVGGKDEVHHEWSDLYTPREPVGRVTWFGYMIGNHHRGHGDARPVDLLKGANLSLRREFWVFDHRLRGRGAQVHNDAQVCLRARRMDGVLIYDPSCVVDHYAAERLDDDRRLTPSMQALADAAHNQVYVVLTYLRWWQRPPYLIYTFLVGGRSSWGIARWLVACAKREDVSLRAELVPSIGGKVAGLKSWIRAHRTVGAAGWLAGDAAPGRKIVR